MAIKFACPACKTPITINSNRAGHLIDCPACGQQLQVPSPGGNERPLIGELLPPDEPRRRRAPVEEDYYEPPPPPIDHHRYDYANKTNPGGTFARAFGGSSGLVLGIVSALLLVFVAIPCIFCMGCTGCAALFAPAPKNTTSVQDDEQRQAVGRQAADRRDAEAREAAAREEARRVENLEREIVRAIRRAEETAQKEAEQKFPKLELPVEQATKRNLDRESYAYKRFKELKTEIAARYNLTAKDVDEIMKRYSN